MSPKKYVKENYWQEPKSSECGAWTLYLQVLECFVSVALALRTCWVIRVEIAAT